MQAVILAGGKGTRLSMKSSSPPKALVKLNNKPILEHQINECLKFGINDIHILVGYKHNEITNYFKNKFKSNVSITYHFENSPLGTGGAILNILDKLDKEFLVIYCDVYFKFNIKRFINFHRSELSDATLFLHPNDHPEDSDLVVLDTKNRITKILNKNSIKKGWYKNLVNAAIFIINKSLLQNLTYNQEKLDLMNDILPKLLKTNNIFGYICHSYAKDMGTPKRLAQVQRDINIKKIENLYEDSMSKAIFLDRDGVINIFRGLINHEDQIKLINKVPEAIKLANQNGFLVIIITNQPVVARGECTFEKLNTIHNKIETLLGQKNAYVDGIYFCPHHPDKGYDKEIKDLKIHCECRKPNTKLIENAKNKFKIDLKKSWFIGDTTSDILTGKRSGTKTILVKTGLAGKDKKFEVEPDFHFNNLYEAIKFIIKN